MNIKTTLLAVCVRYWEDGTLGEYMPCKKGNMWCPEIDIKTGLIINWTGNQPASIHYKICDQGSYFLKNSKGEIVASVENDYVPSNLIPSEYGDYIVMEIDATGKISNWGSPTLDDFEIDGFDALEIEL